MWLVWLVLLEYTDLNVQFFQIVTVTLICPDFSKTVVWLENRNLSHSIGSDKNMEHHPESSLVPDSLLK